jgi:Bacterial type II and III secretion system protein
MRGLRFRTVCVCMTLAIRAGFCLAADPPQQPHLGPAEPIGVLLSVLAAEISSQPLSIQIAPQAIEAIDEPNLGTSVLLASLISPELEEAPRRAPLHPNEIQRPLREAAERLADVGLNEDSEQIRIILARFEREHVQRLLARQTERNSENARDEADQSGKQDSSVGADNQIRLSVKILERKTTRKHNAVAGEITQIGDEASLPVLSPGIVDAVEFAQRIKSMEKDESWKVLSAPTLITTSGEAAQIESGGEFAIPANPPLKNTEWREFGSTLQATATRLVADRIRLKAYIELSQLDLANSVNGIPGISRRRMQSTVELQAGQTLVLRGVISNCEDPATKTTVTTESVITITADIDRANSGEPTPTATSVETSDAAPELLPLFK